MGEEGLGVNGIEGFGCGMVVSLENDRFRVLGTVVDSPAVTKGLCCPVLSTFITTNGV